MVGAAQQFPHDGGYVRAPVGEMWRGRESISRDIERVSRADQIAQPAE